VLVFWVWGWKANRTNKTYTAHMSLSEDHALKPEDQDCEYVITISSSIQAEQEATFRLQDNRQS